MSRIAPAFCTTCRTQVMAQARSPSHVLHLLLTVFTMGL
jgi:hypothetical protein